MPARSHDDLLRALKHGELAPSYYLHGDQDVLKDEAIQAILGAALDPSLRDFNYDQAAAGQLDPEALHALVNTLPMMAERRLVVVRDVEQWKRKPAVRKVLLAYLEKPSPDTVLVLVQGAEAEADADLERLCHSIDCKPLPADGVVEWLERHATALGIRFEPGAAQHLASATGNDLGTLRSELEKLSALGGSEAVSVERIGELVGVRHGETPGDWIAAVLRGDTPQASRLLAPVLDQSGMSGVKLVAMLGTVLTGLAVARSHYDRGSRGSTLYQAIFAAMRAARPYNLPGSWGDMARTWTALAPSWPLPRIEAALGAAYRADRALKDTRVTDEYGVVLSMMLEIMAQPAPRAGSRGRPTGAPA